MSLISSCERFFGFSGCTMGIFSEFSLTNFPRPGTTICNHVRLIYLQSINNLAYQGKVQVILYPVSRSLAKHLL